MATPAEPAPVAPEQLNVLADKVGALFAQRVTCCERRESLESCEECSLRLGRVPATNKLLGEHRMTREHRHRWQLWHSGFSAHVGSRIEPEDRASVLRVARYGARAPVAESRLRYDAERTEVDLVSDASEGPYAGVHRFAALEFLARRVDHIPAKGEVRVRTYGAYASRRRGWWRRCGVVLAGRGARGRARPAARGGAVAGAPGAAAALLRMVFKVEVEVCPRSGGEMSNAGFRDRARGDHADSRAPRAARRRGAGGTVGGGGVGEQASLRERSGSAGLRADGGRDARGEAGRRSRDGVRCAGWSVSEGRSGRRGASGAMRRVRAGEKALGGGRDGAHDRRRVKQILIRFHSRVAGRRAFCWIGLDRPVEAEREAWRALALWRDCNDARYSLASVMAFTGRIGAARDQLDTLLWRYPNDASALALRDSLPIWAARDSGKEEDRGAEERSSGRVGL